MLPSLGSITNYRDSSPTAAPLGAGPELGRGDELGAATIRLDTTRGDEGELAALDELDLALDAVTDLRHTLERITHAAGELNPEG